MILSRNLRLKSEETAQQKAKVEGERADVEKRLSDLQKKLQAQTQQTEEASAALKKADQAISSANRRLSSLKKERETVENRLEKLREESRSVGSNLSSAQTLVEQIARAQYVNLRQKSWQSFIDGDNPNERSRTLLSLNILHMHRRALFPALPPSKTESTTLPRKRKLAVQNCAGLHRKKRKAAKYCSKKNETVSRL